MNLKKVEVLNTRWGKNIELADNIFIAKIMENLTKLSPNLRIDFRDGWEIRLFPHQFYNPVLLVSDFGSSTHFLILLYFMIEF